MSDMFSHCPKLATLDLTNFDTKKVVKFTGMFTDTTSLIRVYVSDKWVVNIDAATGENVEESTVKGGFGSIKGGAWVDVPENPGRLTYKGKPIVHFCAHNPQDGYYNKDPAMKEVSLESGVTKYTLPEPAYTKENYGFKCWNIDGEEYKSGDSVTISSDIIYAVAEYTLNPDYVIALIEELKNPEDSYEYLKRLWKAEEIINAMTDEEKAQITNIKIYYDAMKAWDEYLYPADLVKQYIEDIDTVEYTDKCKKRIDEARAEYEKLTDEQKAYVPNYDVLLNAEKKYQTLLSFMEPDTAAVETVSAISKIGLVENTPTCKAKIDKARTLYDALTDDAKALVTNYATLTKAEADYLAIAVANCESLIKAIGTVELTDDCKAKITAAREAYDALGDIEKEHITNYAVLTKAEDDYAVLEAVANGVKASYAWSDDYKTCTAKLVYVASPEKAKTETVESTSVTVPATCTEKGSVTYTAEFTNTLFEKQTKTIDSPAAGHVWGEPVYKWAEDLSEVAATAVCTAEPTHTISETAKTTKTEIAANFEAAGKMIYTANFENKELFKSQIKEVEIPKLTTSAAVTQPVTTVSEAVTTTAPVSNTTASTTSAIAVTTTASTTSAIAVTTTASTTSAIAVTKRIL